MTEYRRKSEHIEALQFQGTEESAQEVVELLAARGIAANWEPPFTPDPDDPEQEGFMPTAGRLLYQQQGFESEVPATWFIYVAETGVVYHMDPDYFRDMFEEV